MDKVNNILDKLSPEEIKGLLTEEDLEPIRNGTYGDKEYSEEISKIVQTPESEASAQFGTYSTLIYLTKQNPTVKGNIKTVWKKVIDEYEGVKEWGVYSLYDPLTYKELTPLEIFDNIIARPLKEQEEFLRGKIPGIAKRREDEDALFKAFKEATLKTYPDMIEECNELIRLRTALGDPDPEIYGFGHMIEECVSQNIDRAPDEEIHTEYITAIHSCYQWSKRAEESIKALEDMRQGPYNPLIEWIESKAPEESDVFGYNATLVSIKDALDIIIKEEGLTEDNSGDLKAIKSKWNRKIVKILSKYEQSNLDHVYVDSIEESTDMPPLNPISLRTLARDKANNFMPKIATQPTTLEHFDLEGSAWINFAPDGKPKNQLIYRVYTPQGPHQGLTAIERAVMSYTGTILKANTPTGMIDKDRYARVEIMENDYIRGLMGLTGEENIKTHQEAVYNLLTAISMSRLEVDIPVSNKYRDGIIKAIEEIYNEMYGSIPPKNKDKDVRLSIEKNMLIFDVATFYYRGMRVRKYIFEIMPLSEYLGIKFNQTIQVKDSLYRTPILSPESLTPNARKKAEEHGLYAKDRKTKGDVLMLENNLDNLGLKDWVASTIEFKQKKYGNLVIIEYKDLYVQIKGATTPITDREKRTMKTNLKRYLVYLMNNPESEVMDFEEIKEGKKITKVYIHLKESKKDRIG